MTTKTVRIPTADGQADAFAAFPDGGQHPGVLLYMDAFGIRPVLREMATELAERGYYVLVPNVYYRHGETPVVELPDHITAENRSEVFSQLLPLIQEHSADRVRRDADAYLSFLKAQPEVSAGGVGVIGYCMGAALALRTATAHPNLVTALAGFHPAALVTDADDSPHLLAGNLNAGVHIGLAEGDMSPEAISELERTFDSAGVEHNCEIYPDTVHGFTMADTSAFDPAALRRHWDRLLPLLAESLGENESGTGL